MFEHKPDIAVIMSVYKNDKLDYLKSSVESILNQTYKNFVFFIALDGPVSDECDHFLRNLDDSRVKIYPLEENQGLAVALNHLLKIVLANPHFEYIARMDADDISLRSRFEIQRNFLLKYTHIACVGSWYKEIDESGKYLSYQKLPVSNDEIIKYFWKRSPLAHSSVMFRYEMIDKAGFYLTNTIRLEDYMFWSNALKCGMKLANIPQCLLLYRRDKDFYNRRSGISFGFNYIKTRITINRTIHVPSYIYFYSFLVGIIRMMPAFVLKSIYQFHRNHFI